MGPLDYSALGPKAYVIFAVAALLGYFLWRKTKRPYWTLLLTTGLFIGAAFYAGVINMGHVDRLRASADSATDMANISAKAIGGQAYSTSAGGAGTTNKAYKKNMGGGN